jgi:hypothetical protein
MPLTGFKLANVKVTWLENRRIRMPTRSPGLINQGRSRTRQNSEKISSLIKIPPTKGEHNIFGTAVTAEWPR